MSVAVIYLPWYILMYFSLSVFGDACFMFLRSDVFSFIMLKTKTGPAHFFLIDFFLFEWWFVWKVIRWLSVRTFAKPLLFLNDAEAEAETSLCSLIKIIEKGEGLSKPALHWGSLHVFMICWILKLLLTGEAVWSWWQFWCLYERECEFITKEKKTVAVNLPILGLHHSLMLKFDDDFKIY